MTLCRICDRRPATTNMPWTRRPCCAKCLADAIKTIKELRLKQRREYLNLKATLMRHPAGKGPRYVYRFHYNERAVD